MADTDNNSTASSVASSGRFEIPVYTIDLSQPPERRYEHIIPDFTECIEACDLANVYKDLLRQFVGERRGKFLAIISRIVFRRLYSSEETSEIRGISRLTKVPMHVLIAFNVLLDLLLGCTSGGVRMMDPTLPESYSGAESRIFHMRTLDWGMDSIRNIVVELNFVRTAGGPVVATAITYLGYVGVLTGVKKGLSMSLNFRGCHDRSTRRARYAFRLHQLMVLLGLRPSISSELRRLLLNTPGCGHDEKQSRSIDSQSSEAVSEEDVRKILETFSKSRTSAAYLIFCTAQKVFILEKDYRKGSMRESDTFLAAFNHDVSFEEKPARVQDSSPEITDTEAAVGLAEIMGFSVERKERLDEIWKQQVESCRQLYNREDQAVMPKGAFEMLEDEWISNEETHYAVLMDPGRGTIWARTGYEVWQYSSEDESDAGSEASTRDVQEEAQTTS